jgi:hypothetical protein
MAVTEDTTGGLQRVKFTWTCSSAGAYSEASTYRYNGKVLQLISTPGTSDDAPTTLYDIYVYDTDSVDILGGKGADRSATATEYVDSSAGLGYVKSSTLTLTIANAGDVATGSVWLYIYDLDKGVVG